MRNLRAAVCVLALVACEDESGASGEGTGSGTADSSASTSTGAGTTSTTGNTWPPGLECDNPPTVGDFDGDGHLDIVTALGEAAPFGVCILPGLGDGSFAPAIHHEGGHPGFRSPTVTDLDGDGLDDLVVAHYPELELSVRYGTTDGLLGEPRILLLDHEPQDVPWGTTTAIEAGDFDGDGAPDLAVTVLVDPLYTTVFWNDGSGWWVGGAENLTGQADFRSAAAADFDEDGRDEVVSTGGTLLNMYSWTEERALETESIEVAGLEGSVCDAGDVTGDGNPDIALLSVSDGDEECAWSTVTLAVPDGAGGFDHLTDTTNTCGRWHEVLIAHVDPDSPGSAVIATDGPNDALGDDLFKNVFAIGMDAGDFDEDGLDEIAAWHQDTGLRIVEADG